MVNLDGDECSAVSSLGCQQRALPVQWASTNKKSFSRSFVQLDVTGVCGAPGFVAFRL
jgi:hypothetical protein